MNILHIDASSLLIGPIPVQSPLMGSKQHVTNFCKPNECCPFLHYFVPFADDLRKDKFWIKNLICSKYNDCSYLLKFHIKK